MEITRLVGSFLNKEIKIDLDQRVSRNRAYIIICGVVVLVLAIGYLAGYLWFWNPNRNYFEYQIEQINKSSRESAEARIQMAMATYLNGDFPTSEKILQEILAKDPKNSMASLYLGLILSDQKRFNEAIPLLSSNTKQIQGIEARVVYLYLGKDYLAVGQLQLAAQSLGNAEVMDPGNPIIYYNLGQVYEKMNNLNKAVSYYEKALKLSPNYVEPDTALKNLAAKRGISIKTTGSNNSQ